MCRSEPQIPLASMRTIASAGWEIDGSPTSSTRTSPGAWNVTARMSDRPYRPARGACVKEPAAGDRLRELRAGMLRAEMAEPCKAVLISGCSSGIGRATALRLARSGWEVYASARRPESIADLAEAGCRTLALDVTDDASMRAAVEAVEQQSGAVGVLVNN